ncbi:MAG: glycosyltransferase [Deltaproteobacteria bacterium]|nr:glycosyltransferase [Deltaproteobacteria bacterium]
MAYFIYNTIIILAFFMLLPFLPLLLLAGERFRAGLMQRLGFYRFIPQGRSSNGSRPVWIHAASVGEVRSVRVLTEEIKQRFPDRAIILSTLTHTGNLTARQNSMVDSVLYLPLDLFWTVRRALAAFDPAVLIIVETEIWPNLVREAHRKGVPTILLSGRVSEKGFRNYSRLVWFFRQVFQLLIACGMQSEVDRQRIVSLGAAPKRVFVSGNLKQAASSRDNTAVAGDQKGSKRASGFLWVVGSSHRGEEEVVFNAFKLLKETFPELRMVLAPRHPQRFPEVEKLLVASGVSFQKKSQLQGEWELRHDVIFLDTIGELENIYAAGDLAFVGGSLVDAGGHNLLEPARFRKPVLFGPYTSNVKSLAKALKQNGGGFEVRDAGDLVREITTLLSEPERCQAAGDKAYEIASADYSVVERSVKIVANYLATPVDV